MEAVPETPGVGKGLGTSQVYLYNSAEEQPVRNALFLQQQLCGPPGWRRCARARHICEGDGGKEKQQKKKKREKTHRLRRV